MSQAYNIAAAVDPHVTFIPTLKKCADESGVNILAIIITARPLGVNIMLLLEEPNDRFIVSLANVVAPSIASWCDPDVRLTPGTFRDFRTDEEQGAVQIEA